MAGQIWSDNARGGYSWSPNLSKYLRTSMQPMARFRNLCNPVDGVDAKVHSGQTFNWNTYSDVADQGWDLQEQAPIPETNGTIAQGSMTVREAGNSVPYTGLLEDLSEHDLKAIIDKMLRDDCRKYMDAKAYLQFDETPLRVTPTSGTNPTSVSLVTDGIPVTTNNIPLGTGHIKSISDLMRERNIPGFDGDAYFAISHPTTFRPFKNELEDISQYTETGFGQIFAGEIGMYEGMRFITQNHIPKGGAYDSTTFNVRTKTGDAWNNAQSSWAFFMGNDTVAEGIIVPEEIRSKLPGDYGRDKGIAWYYLGGFGLIQDDPDQARIVKWDSAA